MFSLVHVHIIKMGASWHPFPFFLWYSRIHRSCQSICCNFFRGNVSVWPKYRLAKNLDLYCPTHSILLRTENYPTRQQMKLSEIANFNLKALRRNIYTKAIALSKERNFFYHSLRDTRFHIFTFFGKCWIIPQRLFLWDIFL